MKSLRILVLTFAYIFSIGIATGAESIIGTWRAVKSESNDPAYKNPVGEMEMQFTTNGVVTVKLRDPADSAATQTFQGKFTLIPPDRVTFTFLSTAQDRYRYIFIGGKLRMEHLDYPVTNTLERIEKFSL